VVGAVFSNDGGADEYGVARKIRVRVTLCAIGRHLQFRSGLNSKNRAFR
jgi:hypothetical protein